MSNIPFDTKVMLLTTHLQCGSRIAKSYDKLPGVRSLGKQIHSGLQVRNTESSQVPNGTNYPFVYQPRHLRHQSMICQLNHMLVIDGEIKEHVLGDEVWFLSIDQAHIKR